MSVRSLKALGALIFAVLFVNVYCGDVTNSRQTGSWQKNNAEQKSLDILPNDKSTTPWPKLGQRYTTSNPSINTNNGRTCNRGNQCPKKWIQQNNIWIRNEQTASGGTEGVTQTRAGGKRAQVNSAASSTTSTTSSLNSRRGSTANTNDQTNHNGSPSNIEPSTAGPNTRGEPIVSSNGQTSQNIRGQSSPDGSKSSITLPDTRRGSTNNNRGAAPEAHSNGSPSNVGSTGPDGSKSSVNLPNIRKGSTNSNIRGLAQQKQTNGSPTVADSKSTGGSSTDKIEDLDNLEGTAGVDSNVSDDELREFSETLLRKDTNNAMKYVTLNLQGMTTSRSPNDEAPLPLLKIEDAAYKIPSIEKIILLHNNYFLDAGQNEVYTGQERIEEDNLLDTVLATPVMKHTRSFLIKKGKLGKDPKEFKSLMRQIWFNMYSRGNGRIGSSGFEHVFVTEIKNNQVSGLHNWIFFSEEESQKRANYLGYMKKLDLGEKGAVLKLHFTFSDIDKPVGSMFIGTSPELEMALYSTCFILRADRICPLKMNGNRFIIRTYTFRYRGKNMIGSAFPEI